MYSFDATSVITMLVDKLLDRKSRCRWLSDCYCKRKGLGISFRVNVINKDTDSDFNEITRFVNMIFINQTSVFYPVSGTSVFYRVSDRQMFFAENLFDYTNSSNHSSCWRTDGFAFLTKLYFDSCAKLDPKMAPREMYSVDFASQIRCKKLDVTYQWTDDRCELINVKEKGDAFSER